MPDSPPPPVSLADAEIAQRIAASARDGRPVDRRPTVEQLLAAFGEGPEADPAARARIQRALQIAGVTVDPALTEASPGARVTLDPGRGPAGGRGRTLVLGLVALAAVIGGVAAAASLSGSGSGDRASSLPAGTTTTTTGTVSSIPATTATAPTTASASTSTATTPTTTTATTTTPTTTTKTDAAAAAQARRRRAAAQRRKRAAAQAAARRRAARRRVVVSLTASAPTYLCVDDAAGHRLFGGTLTGKRTFRGRRIRVNIGLDSVVMRVNGTRVPLNGSPTGYLLQAGGKAPQYLPLGQRPSC